MLLLLLSSLYYECEGNSLDTERCETKIVRSWYFLDAISAVRCSFYTLRQISWRSISEWIFICSVSRYYSIVPVVCYSSGLSLFPLRCGLIIIIHVLPVVGNSKYTCTAMYTCTLCMYSSSNSTITGQDETEKCGLKRSTRERERERCCCCTVTAAAVFIHVNTYFPPYSDSSIFKIHQLTHHTVFYTVQQ